MENKAFLEGFPIDSINGIEDHLHILLQLPTTQTIAKIVKILKVDSYFWLREQSFFLMNLAGKMAILYLL